ncbi:GNAT family N-acetyltransferase [Candidatus Gottesmanbacteria bacterium]|nr:GNAT family N-acetyltransferase [Candidatus Gottesmanbacteria bacterium]
MKESMVKREKRIETLLHDIKHANSGDEYALQFSVDAKKYRLIPITYKDQESRNAVILLTAWRKKNDWWFPSQFKVTYEGTKRWLTSQLLEKKGRVLFFLEDEKRNKIGHLGLYSFDFKHNSCEIDNVIRGEESAPGVMTDALNTLMQWTYDVLKIKTMYLRVFSDNERAIKLYRRCNFVDDDLIPLVKEVRDDGTYWIEDSKMKAKPERSFLKMRHVPKKLKDTR